MPAATPTSSHDPAAARAAPATRSVAVATPGGRYDILIGAGLLQQPSAWSGLPRAAQAVIVSNPTVDALYGPALQQAIAPHYGHISRALLPDGEQHKDWDSLNLIFDHLLASGCDRKTVLFALGGGVVGDMTGFAAATYMRGVPFVQVPTTLLAQREVAAGLAEVIKYGPIADAAFLGWIEANLDALLACDRAAMAYAVQRSCEIKAEVVGADERESGRRAILNFGHTFGHAIETGMGHGAWLHGEAVACGMVLAGELSVALGSWPAAESRRLRRLIERAGLPVLAPAMPLERWFELMRVDKKAEGGEIRFVVIEATGRAAFRTAPDALVRQIIAQHSAQHGATENR